MTGRSAVEDGGPCRLRRDVLEKLDGAHPSITANGSIYGVVWEAPGDSGNDVSFWSIDPGAGPVGPRSVVEVLGLGDAHPLVIPDGDGFRVFWSSVSFDAPGIAFKQVGRDGRSAARSKILLTGQGVALAALRDDAGYALAWWTWETPGSRAAIDWFDTAGAPIGKELVLTRSPCTSPVVALRPVAAGRILAAWEDTSLPDEHVFVGEIAGRSVTNKLDVAPADAPSLGTHELLYGTLSGDRLRAAPLDGSKALDLSEGVLPRAAPFRGGAILCSVRLGGAGDYDKSALHCAFISRGALVWDQPITTSHEIHSIAVAATAGGYAVAFEHEEEDKVHRVEVVTARCASP